MKKNLTKPKSRRQPTSKEIAAFVSEGSGKDTVKPSISRLTVDLPRDLHRRFKVACVLADTRMNEEIRSFIIRRSAELESFQ